MQYWQKNNEKNKYIYWLGSLEFIVKYTLGKKALQSTFFGASSCHKIEDSIQYLEGPNRTWKDPDRNLGVHLGGTIYLIWSMSYNARYQFLVVQKSQPLIVCSVLWSWAVCLAIIRNFPFFRHRVWNLIHYRFTYQHKFRGK